MSEHSDDTHTTADSASINMDKINTTILKTAIEAIPLLNQDNYTLWKNRVENMLNLQELLDPLVSPTGVLSATEDIQLRTILTSKLESSIHANVITHDNEKSSKKIWKSISEHFASLQASNHTRVFNAVLHLQFNPNNVQEFITQVKTAVSRLHEVGINLPKDIIAYLILHKLPSSMINISQQITHSNKPITLDLWKKGWHNPQATGHSLRNCWFLYPHLRPAQDGDKGKKNEASVSSFHSSVSKLSANFILDSGSSSHMVSNANLFVSLDYSDQGLVRTSSGKDSLEIKGIWTIKLTHEKGNIFLDHVLYIPNLVINLLSVRCLVLNNYHFQFLKNPFSTPRNNNLLITGRYEGNLPCLKFKNIPESTFLSNAEILHKSLGHVSYHRLRQKLGLPLKNTASCEACALGKITKASFKSKHQRAKRTFEELHLDLIGPISSASREGDRYILTVVDSITRYCSATPINQKSDIINILSSILDFEAKRFGYYPSVLHSDRGGEFINSLILRYWSDIVKVSTLTLNQIPSHRSSKSPYEQFRGRSIPLEFFRPIGNPVVFLNEPKKPGAKIYPKGSRERLIGYNEELLLYKILAEDGRLIETKSIQFLDFIPEEKRIEYDDEEDFEIIHKRLSPANESSSSVKELTDTITEEHPEVKLEEEDEANLEIPDASASISNV
ncbi:uncharacterized protein VP01_3938g1, partial [Puccinia sorghi]